jgi:hypothetical protein
MKYRPSGVAQSPCLFQNPWRTFTFLGAERYLCDASAGSGGTGIGGTIAPEEVGICKRAGTLRGGVGGAVYRRGERGLDGGVSRRGERGLDGGVSRRGERGLDGGVSRRGERGLDGGVYRRGERGLGGERFRIGGIAWAGLREGSWINCSRAGSSLYAKNSRINDV